jgi:hypothetical protein
LRTALETDSKLRQSWAMDKVRLVQQGLVPARANVDRVAHLAPQDRSDVLVVAAVSSMVDLMPLMVRVVSDLSNEADRADPLLRMDSRQCVPSPACASMPGRSDRGSPRR